jgi:ssDNA-binding replication factor A large subunit
MLSFLKISNMAMNVNHVITSIRDIRPGQRGYNITCLVIDTKRENAVSKSNQPLYSIWVGDHSGSIIVTLWGDEWIYLRPGDMLKITDAIANMRMKRLQLTIERSGKVRRFGEYLNLIRDLLVFSPTPNMSHVTWQAVEGSKPQLFVFND